MKRITLFFIGTLIWLLCPNSLFALSYFNDDSWAGTYHDANKYSLAERVDEIGGDVNLWWTDPGIGSGTEIGWGFEFDAPGYYSAVGMMDGMDRFLMGHHFKEQEVWPFDRYQDTIWYDGKLRIHADSQVMPKIFTNEISSLGSVPPPAPATPIMFVLGSGLIGFIGYNTKKFKTLWHINHDTPNRMAA